MDKFLVLLFLCSLIGCSTGQLPYRWVGDITHDPGLDKTDFLLCHREKDVRQYFNTVSYTHLTLPTSDLV